MVTITAAVVGVSIPDWTGRSPEQEPHVLSVLLAEFPGSRLSDSVQDVS